MPFDVGGLIPLQECTIVSEAGVKVIAELRDDPLAVDEKRPYVYFVSLTSFLALATGTIDKTFKPQFDYRTLLVDLGTTCYKRENGQYTALETPIKLPAKSDDDSLDVDNLYITHHDFQPLLMSITSFLFDGVFLKLNHKLPHAARDTKCVMAYLHALERRCVRKHQHCNADIEDNDVIAKSQYTNDSFLCMTTFLATGLLHQTFTSSYYGHRPVKNTEWTFLSAMFESVILDNVERYNIINNKILQTCIFFDKYRQVVDSVDAERELLQRLDAEENAAKRAAIKQEKKRNKKHRQRQQRAAKKYIADGNQTDLHDDNKLIDTETIMKHEFFKQQCQFMPIIIELEEEEKDEDESSVKRNSVSILSPMAPIFVPSFVE